MGAGIARDFVEGRHGRPRLGDRAPAQRSPGLEPHLPHDWPRVARYLTVRQRFVLATVGSLTWCIVSVALARPWSAELASVTGSAVAWAVIALVAIVPGFLNAH